MDSISLHGVEPTNPPLTTPKGKMLSYLLWLSWDFLDLRSLRVGPSKKAGNLLDSLDPDLVASGAQNLVALSHPLSSLAF